MTPDEVAANRADLLTFTSTMFRARKSEGFIIAPHHYQICNALERVVIGKTKRLIINIPPRAGKTELAVINFMAWCMGNFPDSEFIHSSYSKRLAAANTYSVRAMMLHEKYNEIFPHTRLAGDSKAKDEFRTAQGGIVYATGSEGTITGYGAGKKRKAFGGCLIVDDPHKPGEAHSVTMRENVLDWFSTTLESRKNNPDTPIIIIMQRLHEVDLSGFLLNGGNGEQWEHLCIPAINEDGVSFWPDQFPASMLENIKRSNQYVYSGQYLQEPSPLGGSVFKREWFRYHDYTLDNPPPGWTIARIYCDTASKTGQHNDYSVFSFYCYSQHTDSIYLLDQVRGKFEAPELEAALIAFWKKNKFNHYREGGFAAQEVVIEDASSGIGLIQALQRRSNIPVRGITRIKDKVTRAFDVAPRMAAGQIYFPRDASWLADLELELERFTPELTAAHDDQIDPLMDAATELLIEGSVSYLHAL